MPLDAAKLEEFLRELVHKSGAGELLSKVEEVFHPKESETEVNSDAQE